MIVLDGKAAAAQVKADIAAQVQQLTAAAKRPPKLACILVGSKGASITYVANKQQACKAVGMDFQLLQYENNVSQQEILDTIFILNEDSSVDGFIVQLPLPQQISEERIIEAISPHKDVDGFHPQNLGRMSAGLPSMIPATPLGITELLRYYKIPTAGKHCVVLGRSNIVGRPAGILLSQKEFNCTVTLCHSATQRIPELCRSADIIVAALGKPEFVTAEMVRDGAVIIDVGITRIADSSKNNGYRLLGDVKYNEVAVKCSAITPVPGGVGPMTIAALLKNTMLAYKKVKCR